MKHNKNVAEAQVKQGSHLTSRTCFVAIVKGSQPFGSYACAAAKGEQKGTGVEDVTRNR